MKNSISYLLALVAIGHFLGYIQAHPIQITVETSAGNSLNFELESTDTIKQVKDEIEKREHVPAGLRQRLHFGGKELKGDEKQLQDYGVTTGALLVQSLQPKKASFKNVVGKTFRSIVTCCMKDEDPEDSVQQMPETSIVVFVKTSHGIRISLEIAPTESIARLKQAIESVTNVSADDQRLYLDDGSAHLLERRLDDDNRTLDSYGITNDSTILQVFHPKNALELIIEPSNGQVFTSFFQPTDTIGVVKREIGKRSGIPLDQQILRVATGGQLLEDEGRTLASYTIEDGSTIVQRVSQRHA